MPGDLRIQTGVTRGQPFQITVNGNAVEAYPGETIAAVLLAEGWQAPYRAFRGATRVILRDGVMF